MPRALTWPLIAIALLLNASRCLGAPSAVAFSPDDLEGNVQGADSVVKVVGTEAGAGGIIFYDNQPAILTNSHVIQNEKTAVIELGEEFPDGLGRPGNYTSHIFRKVAPKPGGGYHQEGAIARLRVGSRGKVLFNSPDGDLAVVAAPTGLDPDTLLYFRKAAAMNGYYCSGKVPGCDRRFSDQLVAPSKATRLNSVPHGQATSVEMVAPFAAVHAPDAYVSGHLDAVILAPAFSKPGFSGGVYYENGKFAGLASLVSTGMGAFTVIIPSDQIAKVLAGPERGRWVPGPHGNVLELRDGHETLTSSPATGTLAFGGEGVASHGGEGVASHGGEGVASHGGEGVASHGGDAGDSRYWTLRYFDATLTRGPESAFGGKSERQVEVLSRKTAETQNPYLAHPDELRIGKREVAYLEFPRGSHRYIPASAPAYIAIKNRFGGNVELHGPGDPALENARRQADHTIRFGRLYAEERPGTFAQTNNNCDDLVGDQAQALLPGYDRMPKPTQPHDPRCVGNKTRAKADRDGFHEGFPFATRMVPELALDTRFRTGPKEPESELQVGADLRRLTLTRPDDSGKPVTTHLEPEAGADPSRTIYRAVDGDCGARAVAIFDQDNLANLSRLLVNTHGALAELVACDPGAGCR